MPWVVDRDHMKTRSKNTLLDEMKLLGRVLRITVAGETVYRYV